MTVQTTPSQTNQNQMKWLLLSIVLQMANPVLWRRKESAIRAKISQIEPSRDRIQQDSAKFFKGINFDFLVRIEPFQALAPTPQGQKILL
jgi:hypothetical protein